MHAFKGVYAGIKEDKYLEFLPKVSALRIRLIASAVGTTLLQSPGCNEGKARNETLGTHKLQMK